MKKRKIIDVPEDLFFQSSEYIRFMKNTISLFLERYHVRQEVGFHSVKRGSGVAWTDFKDIFIRHTDEFLKGLSLEEKFRMTKGLLVHEISHILFTNRHVYSVTDPVFTRVRDILLDYASQKGVYLKEEEEKFLKEDIPKEKEAALYYSFFRFSNILEDGFIEDVFLRQNRGASVNALRALREYQQKGFREMEETAKETYTPGQRVSFASLLFAKYAGIPSFYDDDSFPEKEAFFRAIPYIEKAVNEWDKERRDVYKVLAFRHLQEYLVEEGSYDSVPDSVSEDLEKAKGTVRGRGPMSPLDDPSGEFSESGDSGRAEALKDALEKALKEGSEELKEEIKESLKKLLKASMERSSGSSEADESPFGTPAKGSPEGEDSSDRSLTKEKEEAEKKDHEELESLLKKVREELEEEMAKEEGLKEEEERAKKFSSSDGVGSFHKTNIFTPKTNKSLYKEIFGPEERRASKTLQKKFLEELKLRKSGFVEKNLYLGKKLTPEHLHRDDGRVFSKKVLPSNEADIAIGVLVDESGSMRGNREAAARVAAIVFDDFCRGLEIPHCVYGHTGDSLSGRSLDMVPYISFDSPESAKYGLADISAKVQNRDGNAIAYLADILKERPERRKIMLCITDGIPAASGYGGKSGIAHTRRVMEKYRKDILFLALCISEDKGVAEIFDRIVYLDDLSSLPKKLIKMISKYI